MATKLLLPWCCLAVPVAATLAGDPVQIDKDFTFRLDQPTPGQSPSVPFPPVSPRPGTNPHAPLRTPEGRTLPPGTRPFQFNGRTYYRIPLGSRNVSTIRPGVL